MYIAKKKNSTQKGSEVCKPYKRTIWNMLHMHLIIKILKIKLAKNKNVLNSNGLLIFTILIIVNTMSEQLKNKMNFKYFQRDRNLFILFQF